MTPSPASLIDLKMCITRFVRTCKASGAAIVVLLAIGVATAQTNSAQHDSSVYAELAKAPKKAVDRHNPMEADPDAVAAGGKLFGQHCAECHGEMAEGGKEGPQSARG